MNTQPSTTCGYWTVPETAAFLRASAETVRQLAREGRLHAVRLRPRGRLLFDPAEVRAALHDAQGEAVAAHQPAVLA